MQRVTLHHPQAERDGTWNGDRYHDDCDDDDNHDDGGNIEIRKALSGSVQKVLLGLVLKTTEVEMW